MLTKPTWATKIQTRKCVAPKLQQQQQQHPRGWLTTVFGYVTTNAGVVQRHQIGSYDVLRIWVHPCIR